MTARLARALQVAANRCAVFHGLTPRYICNSYSLCRYRVLYTLVRLSIITRVCIALPFESMDPITGIGLAASIAQLLDATMKFIDYVNRVKKAPQHRVMLAIEATTLLGLLTSLKYRVEQAELEHDPWYLGVQSLGGKNGPIEQLKLEMATLVAKLEPKFGGSLTWPFSETTIDNTLARVERLKSHIGLALQDDHL